LTADEWRSPGRSFHLQLTVEIPPMVRIAHRGGLKLDRYRNDKVRPLPDSSIAKIVPVAGGNVTQGSQ
jgi:hypothetical protein